VLEEFEASELTFPAILMMKHTKGMLSDEITHDYSHITALYFVLLGYPEMLWQHISITLATVIERGECLDQVTTVVVEGPEAY
jgi:hypothetical protein